MARPRKEPAAPADDTTQRLIEALAPFAAHGRRLRLTDPRAQGRKVVYEHGPVSLTMADFDRVAALLRELSDD